MSLQLLAVTLVAAIGGLAPGLAAAVAAPLLVNWFLIPPYHTLRIGDTENLVALVVFMSVAALVSAFVSMAARRAAEAERLRDEAHTLASLVGVGGPDPMGAIAAHLVDAFDLDGVSAFRVDPTGGPATVVEATAGAGPPRTIADASFHRAVGSDVVLAGSGRALTSEDDRVLRSFVQQLERALEQRRLAAVAADAEALAQADALRTSLLRAVSHDLRTPLAGVKAAVSSLRQPDVEWSEAERETFLEAIEVDTDRLTEIITNLLELSKLHAGAMRPSMRPTSLDEVVASVLHQLGPPAGDVHLDLAREADDVLADPALLERVVANLVGNALDWSPPGQEVRVATRRGATVCSCTSLTTVRASRGGPRGGRAAVPPPRRRLARRARPRAGDRRSDDGGDGRRSRAVGHARRRSDGGGLVGAAMTRVLCVDDEPQLLRTLGANLKARHYDVDLAMTGEQAVDLAAAAGPTWWCSTSVCRA